MSDIEALSVLGITEDDVKRFATNKAAKGRRDSRVCVCGHPGGAHFGERGSSVDSAITLGEAIHCQAGKTPCECNHFNWVLTISDVRSFIQKTMGPGPEHALTKGLASSFERGLSPEWREGLHCFKCKRKTADGEVGTLTAIAYNEAMGEAMRPTAFNALMCSDCRAEVQAGQ